MPSAWSARCSSRWRCSWPNGRSAVLRGRKAGRLVRTLFRRAPPANEVILHRRRLGSARMEPRERSMAAVDVVAHASDSRAGAEPVAPGASMPDNCEPLRRTPRLGPSVQAMSALPFRVLSVIPPMTQLNTPYPSTAYLTGFLRSRGIEAAQEDLALALVLDLLSPQGLDRIREHATGERFAEHFAQYRETIAPTIAFLQGADPTLAHRIASRRWLPEGPRFRSLDAFVADEDGGDPLAWAFGALGLQDRARHIATLYLNDLADVLRDAVDERFEFVRYAEKLATSQPTFEPLAAALAEPPNLVDLTLQALTAEALARHAPDVVLLSVPFPGAVYAALRIAQAIKRHDPRIVTVLGGGFVNTELRDLREPRLFDYVDFVTLDA